MRITPPRYIVWSTDTVDMEDPFQRKWYIRQVLLHGRTQDVRALSLDDLSHLLDDLELPSHIHRLWEQFLETRHA
jgi:hypothetical protein